MEEEMAKTNNQESPTAELLSDRINKLIDSFPSRHWDQWVLINHKTVSNPTLGVEIAIFDEATSRSTIFKINDIRISLSVSNADNLRKFVADLKLRLSIQMVQSVLDKPY